MRPRTIKYYIASAVKSLFRNRLMSFASIFTVASCIFIVSVFYVLAANMGHILEYIEEQIGIVAFVDDDFPHSEPEMTRLWQDIYDLPHVYYVEYISPDDAILTMEDIFGEGSAMLDWVMLGGNPLRRAFHVELTALHHHDDVYNALLAMNGIVLVRSDRNLVGTVQSISDIVQIVSLALIAMLAIISVVIIINTIRITVSARQTEINIMKYVGATDWFIRWPFVIEGLLIGLIGGTIPAVITRFGYEPVVDRISAIAFLDFMEFLSGEYIFVYLFPFAMTLGTVIGLIGSLISVRRHLRV